MNGKEETEIVSVHNPSDKLGREGKRKEQRLSGKGLTGTDMRQLMQGASRQIRENSSYLCGVLTYYIINPHNY